MLTRRGPGGGLRSWVILFLIASPGVILRTNVHARNSFLDELNERDLLQAIKIPFDDPTTQFFENGSDGFPAMGMRPGSDIKSPYRLFMPEKFYQEFSIAITAKMVNREGGGFIFAVVNPLDTVVELGVSVVNAGGANSGSSNVSLLYTDLSTGLYSSQTLASFLVPTTFTSWTQLGIKVTKDAVSVYLNCQHYETANVKRDPLELLFDSASTLYIGQAGPIIKGAFHGAIQELKVYGHPNTAEIKCNKDFT